jgi:4-diphosphocytidyl-2C-methyl-D-erythritol kinase
VPFLASEHASAHALGRGDKLAATNPRLAKARDVLLIVPSFSISTADAYRWLDEDRPPGRSAPVEVNKDEGWIRGGATDLLMQGMLGGLTEAFRRKGFERYGGNDFEPVVEKRYPVLREYRERLQSLGASCARLAGSGSCVFGIFEGRVPSPEKVGADALVVPTRTSARVVQVEVLE